MASGSPGFPLKTTRCARQEALLFVPGLREGEPVFAVKCCDGDIPGCADEDFAYEVRP